MYWSLLDAILVISRKCMNLQDPTIGQSILHYFIFLCDNKHYYTFFTWLHIHRWSKMNLKIPTFMSEMHRQYFSKKWLLPKYSYWSNHAKRKVIINKSKQASTYNTCCFHPIYKTSYEVRISTFSHWHSDWWWKWMVTMYSSSSQ